MSLEYCRAGQTENSIFYVDATSKGTVDRSFEKIAVKLAPDSIFPDPEAARTFVLKKFEELSDPVLLIFDNYGKPVGLPPIRGYLPHRSKMIFNHTDAKKLSKSVEVGAMTTEVSILRSAFSLVKCSSLVA